MTVHEQDWAVEVASNLVTMFPNLEPLSFLLCDWDQMATHLSP